VTNTHQTIAAVWKNCGCPNLIGSSTYIFSSMRTVIV